MYMCLHTNFIVRLTRAEPLGPPLGVVHQRVGGSRGERGFRICVAAHHIQLILQAVSGISVAAVLLSSKLLVINDFFVVKLLYNNIFGLFPV